MTQTNGLYGHASERGAVREVVLRGPGQLQGLEVVALGAFDFAVLPDGQWVFYECNPSGQWQFIAAATGLPIAEAHASLLTGAIT
ncbi:hypothetical protein [Streptomyces sp. NBC_00448]|uniref:hypothetical protein n=1 Tax=Streptomyces sp. NBC_00448 TaxID=2903652 RepID=UPI002E21A13D